MERVRNGMWDVMCVCVCVCVVRGRGGEGHTVSLEEKVDGGVRRTKTGCREAKIKGEDSRALSGIRGGATVPLTKCNFRLWVNCILAEVRDCITGDGPPTGLQRPPRN